jgi:hypothetical protein
MNILPTSSVPERGRRASDPESVATNAGNMIVFQFEKPVIRLI